MAEAFEVEVNGQVYEVEADTPQQAATYARLLAARNQGTTQATAGAAERSKLTPAEQMVERQERLKTIDPAREREMTMMMRSKEPGAAGAALALTSAIPLAGGLIMAPGATAASLGAGYVGSKGGSAIGREAENYGAPEGTSKALGLVGGLGGGIYGGIKGQAILKDLLKSGVGSNSMLGQVITRLAGTEAAAGGAVARETTEEAAKKAALALERQQAEIASIRAASDKARAEAARVAAKQAQEAERHELQKQLLQRRLEGKPPLRLVKSKPAESAKPAGPAKPPEEEIVLSDDAVSVVPEPAPAAKPSAPFDQTAKPGDAATIAEQIQQKSGILTGATPDGRKIVAAELEKLPESLRNQVEAILARGQARPATTYQPTPGTPRPAPYKPSVKPLDNPVLEAARKEGSKAGRTWGEKIYLELDAAGNPVRVLNGPQAATALERRGIKTTWVKNLWGEVHDARSAGAANAE